MTCRWNQRYSQRELFRLANFLHSSQPSALVCHWLRILPILICLFRLRSKAGFLLLSGIIPRRPLRLLPLDKKKRPSRNFDIYLRPVLEEFRELFLTGSDCLLFSLLSLTLPSGMKVYDASVDKVVVSKAYLLYATADIRAFPHLNSQMSAPAIEGACDQCHIQGTRLHPDNRTIYPGAYRSVRQLSSHFLIFGT